VVGVQCRLLVVGLFIGLATNDGHAQRIGDQFGAHVLGNGPADDEPGVGVHHCGTVQDAFGGAVFGDIGNPQPIWRGDGEVAVDQIGAGCRVRGADRAAATSTPVEPWMPAWRITRATRLRFTDSPSPSVSSAWTRGEPYVFRESA
jgi:hypothetical protein